MRPTDARARVDGEDPARRAGPRAELSTANSAETWRRSSRSAWRRIRRRRYQTADELAGDLDRFLRGEAVVARPVGARRRFRRAKRRPLQTFGVAAVLLSLALLPLAYSYWDAHFRTKVEYYANFTKVLGAPQGVGRVTEAEARGTGL